MLTEEDVTLYSILDVKEPGKVTTTSAAKKKQNLLNVASAIHTVSNDDIRRMGAQTIADALRYTPGVHIAQIRSSLWGVTSRGFNDQFANKLLTLIDGRETYNHIFSGTYWDVQDPLMEDIDRIEVIRGPGATLWGANAVNGVINVISKPTSETQGLYITGGGGSELLGFGAMRYGGNISDDAWFRIHSKVKFVDDAVSPSKANLEDDWYINSHGLRIDWDPNIDNILMLDARFYQGTKGFSTTVPNLNNPPSLRETLTDDVEVHGAHFLMKWTHIPNEDNEMNMQFYWDRTYRDTPQYFNIVDSFDFEAQHRWQWNEYLETTYGLNYSGTLFQLEGRSSLSVAEENTSTNLFTAFIQNEIDLIDDILIFTMGSKFEHNDYTGFEIQPSARLLWKLNDKNSLWTSVSRAVRTPNEIELYTSQFNLIDGSPPILTQFEGSAAVESEDLVALELGYRSQPTDSLSIDLALFYNIYEDFQSPYTESVTVETEPITHILNSLSISNQRDAETYGAEMAIDWNINDIWRVYTAYSIMNVEAHREAVNINESNIEDISPQQILSARSHFTLFDQKVELDLGVRYVDQIENQNIPAYTQMDVHIGYLPNENLEFSIVGQSLLDDQQPEFSSSTLLSDTAAEIERSIFGQITLRY
ncbi:MAG: TonB-dependent receptor [Verrucomicrobiota bacterium]